MGILEEINLIDNNISDTLAAVEQLEKRIDSIMGPRVESECAVPDGDDPSESDALRRLRVMKCRMIGLEKYILAVASRVQL